MVSDEQQLYATLKKLERRVYTWGASLSTGVPALVYFHALPDFYVQPFIFS